MQKFVNQVGDEIILNGHEFTDDTFPKTFCREFYSSDDPSVKVIFVQVLLKNDQRYSGACQVFLEIFCILLLGGT